MSGNLIKPTFVRCSVSEVPYLRGEKVENDPVNLATVSRIQKLKYNWYPDNVGLPGIMFRGPEPNIHWAYRDEAMRDADFERIANNEF